MQITPPYGYQEVVPFLKTHKVRLPAPGAFPEFVRQGNAIPLSFAEFQPAAREYPIIFSSGSAGGSYVPVVVLGIAQGENLFYDGTAWAGGAYIPAYVRRFPFCMAKVSVNRVERKDRLICVEKAALTDDGVAMFDAQGAPGERWVEIERLLREYEGDAERALEMGAILAEYGLLEPFGIQATLKGSDAPPLQVTGMHRVAEKKLENLNAAQLRNLLKKGILARLYVHLMSLENFGRLLERKSAKDKAA
jgi:hypothetical protein